MQLSLYAICLILLAFVGIYTAQAAPSSFDATIFDRSNRTSTLAPREGPKEGDTNCRGTECPILERNLFRALKKYQNEAGKQYTQLTSRTDMSKDPRSHGGVMIRLMCDRDEDYIKTGNLDGVAWGAVNIVDVVLNKFYFLSECGSCGSYYLDSHCQITIDYCQWCEDIN